MLLWWLVPHRLACLFVETSQRFGNIILSETYHTELAIFVAQLFEGTLSLRLAGEFPVTKTVREGV
jgi:hypothetical protein